MIAKIMEEIDCLISVLKVKIYELEKQNKSLKKQIQRLHTDLDNFLKINNQINDKT